MSKLIALTSDSEDVGERRVLREEREREERGDTNIKYAAWLVFRINARITGRKYGPSAARKTENSY